MNRLAQHERSFWIAALAWYGIGDSVTTIAGLRYADVAEIGPVAGPVLDTYGPSSLLLIKVLFFAVAAGAWYVISRPTRVAIPVAITLVGVAVTLWNVIMIVFAQSG